MQVESASHKIPTYWYDAFSKVKENIWGVEDHDPSKESELRAFYSRHDLAESIPGIGMPSLFILRAGEKCIVASEGKQAIVDLDEMYELLSKMGDEIVSWIGDAVDDRNRIIIESWKCRDSAMRCEIDNKVSLLAGMNDEDMVFLSENAPNFWENRWKNNIFTEGAIFAVARMTSGYVSKSQQKIVLNLIKNTPLVHSADLEKATRYIGWAHWGHSPHEQGYYIAEKFRNYSGVSQAEPVDPEVVLNSWGIAICEVQLVTSGVEAIACWGELHGPLIILNTAEGKKSSHIYGRKFTLGHELCHLLVDRGSTLEVCEVLGGNTLALFEKRASAFAAELLFPKNLANQLIKKYDGKIYDNIDELRNSYNVTKENIVAQMLNHSQNSRSLSESEVNDLRTLLRDPTCVEVE